MQMEWEKSGTFVEKQPGNKVFRSNKIEFKRAGNIIYESLNLYFLNHVETVCCLTSNFFAISV
jgi:hypothetical protein